MTDDKKLNEERQRPSGMVLILIVACWLIFLYFFGGKGPG